MNYPISMIVKRSHKKGQLVVTFPPSKSLKLFLKFTIYFQGL